MIKEIKNTEILCFTLDEKRLAGPLGSVHRVLLAMAVTLIPDAPPSVYGVIDYHGDVIAIINSRCKLKLPEQHIGINDRFIIVNTLNRKIGIVADKVEGVKRPLELDCIEAEEINSELKCTRVLRDDDGIILVYDLERLMNDLNEMQEEQPAEPMVLT